MLSARLGHMFDEPLKHIARKIPLSPNALTIAGFSVMLLAALTIPFNIRLGGLLIIVGGVCDMLDGIVARTTGRVTRFGAYLDSVLDRYADASLFLSLSWYLAAHQNHTGAFLSLGTLVGAFLVSYARARAEGLGETCTVGIMERPERIILMIIGTLTGWLMPIVWILFILTHVTVLQRILYVRKKTLSR